MGSRALAIAIAVMVAFGMAAATAQATVVHCGDILTKNTTFGNDLDCGGNALGIGADGIVVDLNGHTIFVQPGGNGISLNGHNRVTIKNGTLSIPDFSQVGIEVDGDRNTIAHMTLIGGRGATNERTVFGIRLGDGADGNTITSTRLTEWLYGIYAREGSSNTTISDDVLERNACVGVFLEAHPAATASGDVITHSIARNNEFYGFLTGGLLSGSARDCNLGFFGASGEWGGRVADNTASNNGELGFEGSDFSIHNANGTTLVDHNVATGGVNGIRVFSSAAPSSSGPVVSRNRVDGAETGFVFTGNGLTVRANSAQRSAFDGFLLSGADGASLVDNIAGNPTPLSTNEQSGNSDNGFHVVNSVGVHMAGNNANKNGLDGALIESDSTGADVRSTIAGRNVGNGIEVQAAPATIGSNRATFNGGFGILATPGDTDGGGNVAYGNAAGQCQNVFCTP